MEAVLDNEAAIAIVSGEPFLQLPEDLYIPPEALKVFLETFEGPLDLLLYLIRKQNLDILNIPIAQISKQYMRYIDVMSNFQLELAAEYLLMAALLAEIKSRMLLPRQVNLEEEEEDPRAVLVRRLQEYERIKKAAEDLEEIPRMERDIFIATVDTSTVNVHKCQPEVQLHDIVLALQGVLQRVDQLSHHIITKEPSSVRERMALIMGRLEDTSR
jgi:segregation and condensation protein A